MLRLVSLLTVVGLTGCGADEKSPQPSAPRATIAVTINVEFQGASEDKTFDVTFPADAGLLQALNEARSRDKLEFETEGEGELVYVTSIDGVEGEGAGDGARNWQYWVNGEYATTGVGTRKLAEGDEVTWKFATFDDAHAENEP